MNWGKWIVVAFVSFAAFITVLAVVCIRQDISLVSTHYYEDDLKYQQDYDQISNANALAVKPAVFVKGKNVYLSYESLASVESGTLSLVRPSDEKLDHTFVLITQPDSVQHFTISDLSAGLYHVRLKWKQQGKLYRMDRTIVI